MAGVAAVANGSGEKTGNFACGQPRIINDSHIDTVAYPRLVLQDLAEDCCLGVKR